MTQYVALGTFSAPMVGSLGKSPPKCEIQCPGQTSAHMQNFDQIHSAILGEMRPRQTDRQTDSKLYIPPLPRR